MNVNPASLKSPEMTAIRLLLLLALTTSPVVPGLAADSGKAAVQAERLQQLRTHIGDLKNELESMHGKKNALDTELEKTEKELGAVASDLRRLDRKIGQSRTTLDESGTRASGKSKKTAGSPGYFGP